MNKVLFIMNTALCSANLAVSSIQHSWIHLFVALICFWAALVNFEAINHAN